MTITLYKVTEDRRQLTKTCDNTTKVVELSCTIKGDCSIMKPVLEVTYNAQIINANYLHIAAWNRYYFIENIHFDAQRLFLECSVDVLMSHKSDIKELECMVERAEESSKTDLYMNDKAFKAEARKIVQTRKFPYKFPDSVSIVLTTGGPS